MKVASGFCFCFYYNSPPSLCSATSVVIVEMQCARLSWGTFINYFYRIVLFCSDSDFQMDMRSFSGHWGQLTCNKAISSCKEIFHKLYKRYFTSRINQRGIYLELDERLNVSIYIGKLLEWRKLLMNEDEEVQWEIKIHDRSKSWTLSLFAFI